ncbi:MAG TPA: UrcA family protein [Sphingomonas sp.]|uniref:UrcA family protein n=1 Tax=Sphingomonas sp. TaxID=28214 RepID=UPI002CBA9861|nr:UrcA family protein [Sphingomonas sp.]HMI18921.1 UrcA family protein [Sphingomonas sp.]
MIKTIITFAALAALASPLAAAPKAHAWKVGDDSYHLYYTDLDTNTASGRATLLTRVEQRAGELCNTPLRVDQRACVKDALARIPNANLQRALAERDSNNRLTAR